MVRFANVTFSYPGAVRPAIAELDLTIEQGESVCILGDNGSGKSTLARLLVGLETPARGNITVGGGPPRSTPVGFVFQNVDNQIVASTVDKEIAFGLENVGMEREKMRNEVERVLNCFSISALRNRVTSSLSGGEKQRVALASVMVLEPGVLILDEPDSHLDVPGRRMLHSELRAIKERHPDLVEIRITQYPHVAREYPRVLLFDDGRIVADGRPEEVVPVYAMPDGKPTDTTAEMPEGFPDFKSKTRGMIDSVSFDNVSFGYDGTPLIDHLSVSVSHGECVGLVGPSGTGKSTIIHLMTGLLEPVRGQVKYIRPDAGQVAPSEVEGRITAVSQQPERQFFRSTCAEEIAFGPSNRGIDVSDGEIAQILRMVGLPEEMAVRDPFSLSGGEQRRLAFAVSLALQPQFIAFDEPVSGLDREGVARFLSLSRRLKAGGVGQVIASHDGEVIEALTDRVLLLRTDGTHCLYVTGDFFASEVSRDFVSVAEAV